MPESFRARKFMPERPPLAESEAGFKVEKAMKARLFARLREAEAGKIERKFHVNDREIALPAN